MEVMREILKRISMHSGLAKSEKGQTLIEYVLVLVLVVLVLIAAYQSSNIAGAITNALSEIVATIEAA